MMSCLELNLFLRSPDIFQHFLNVQPITVEPSPTENRSPQKRLKLNLRQRLIVRIYVYIANWTRYFINMNIDLYEVIVDEAFQTF